MASWLHGFIASWLHGFIGLIPARGFGGFGNFTALVAFMLVELSLRW